MVRKICVVTGTRAEYGVMRQTLECIRSNPNLDLVLVVTGMHLSKTYGNTISDIKKDGFKIGKTVDAHMSTVDNFDMAKSFGRCVIGMAESFQSIGPDIVLLEGDRIEMLAAAIAAAYMNIPIVHVSGGDISGSIDNSVRKAITNFAHMHLANTQKSADRIVKIGEQSWRVKMVGSLGLSHDVEDIMSPEGVASEFDLDREKPIVLVIQHPVTGESACAREHMEAVMEAVVKLNQQTVIIYPNSDAGGMEMIDVIEKYRKCQFIKIFKSLPRREFLSLMSIADVMIGNSSSALVEAPIFNLFAIDVGTRQKGRERGTNVVNVGYDANEIYDATKRIMSVDSKRLQKIKSPYKDMDTSQKITEILVNVKIDEKLLNKYGE